MGAAGGGKTAILHQAVTALRADGTPTLVLRLDRYGPLGTTIDLGRQLGLEVSPVVALAAASGDRPAVLVIDQLDAVSLASGRLPDNFDVVADLLTEAMGMQDLHVVLGCRQFDVDNDHRIRSHRDRLEATVLSVPPLSEEQVEAAVAAFGLRVAALSAHQRDILRLPLHLTMLAGVADRPDALAFVSTERLFDAYWERKVQAALARRPSVRFGQVVGRLAEVISQRQQLSVPITVLDDEDLTDDAAVLVSEQLLVRDGVRVAFFHETFFDYAFARRWAQCDESLVDFLTAGEQELFRRGQVRQIVAHLRAVDPARSVEEMRQLLLAEPVRFHLKETVLAVLGGLGDPETAEADMVIEVAAARPPLRPHLWSALRTPAWFDRLDTDGHIADWLRGDEEAQERVLTMMAAAADAAPDRLAELLTEHQDAPSYPAWLRWVTRFATLGASRGLFDVCVDGVRRGCFDGVEHDLWLYAHDLPQAQPEWAVELLAAVLRGRPAGLLLNDGGRVALLDGHESHGADLIRKAAAGAPRRFRDALLPYVLDVMAVTAYEPDDDRPRLDRQFSHRYPDSLVDADLDEALFTAMASAIRKTAETDPAECRPALEWLVVDPHDSAQWLLYQGLISGGAAYAGWAADLLLQGPHRLLCGVAANAAWTPRQVVQAISPHLDDETFGRLEARFRDLRFPWEQRRGGGYAFTLLSALEERRLSEVGRRRLGELRRAAGTDQPREPEGITAGFIGPPIPVEAAVRMSDDDWVRAMAKHADEREDFRTFTGGARELAQVLREQTTQHPARFAHLALRLTSTTHPAYGDALLMGLGQAQPVPDEGAVFTAVRHIAALGHSDHDRWLGSALRPYRKTVPLDLVELIRDRLITAADPSDDRIGFTTDDGSGRQVPDLRMSGINTARGALAEALADLLLHDTDGTRTALVVPVLARVAEDPSVPVRSCVARLVAACLRHALSAATEALWRLVDADDALLATGPVVSLVLYIGNHTPSAVQPLVARMLDSPDDRAREAGGQLAAVSALEWDDAMLLEVVLGGEDGAARKGAARIAARRLPRTASAGRAAATLAALFDDRTEDVRRRAAEVAAALRDRPLRPFASTIQALVASPAFTDAVPQLLITLEHAPDRIDDLALACVQRFVDVLGPAAADIRTGSAADVQHVGQLVVRGLAQAATAIERAALLDVLDQLLQLRAYAARVLRLCGGGSRAMRCLTAAQAMAERRRTRTALS